MSVAITVIVEPQATTTVEIGTQATVRKFATTAAMDAVVGRAGDIAYAYDDPDTWYKWSTVSTEWQEAF